MTARPRAARRTKIVKGWHPQDIKSAIWKRGMTLSGLARRNGLHESACRQALVRSTPLAEKAISEFLGVPLCKLWPDRWDADGGRIRHVRDENRRVRAETHRLTAGAR